MRYPAYVRRERDRRLVSFPDCPGCETFAEPEEDVYTVAHEALETWLEAVLAARDVPPVPGMIEHEPGRQRDRLMMVTVGPLLSARVQIRNRREEFGISQQQLAATVGVSQQAIAKIESPDANVRLETLERVAGALALDVDLNLIPRQPKRGAA
jgi:DNA-binding XRE family transcriptional regulator/predicted RNase H-like HicB family nuclease